MLAATFTPVKMVTARHFIFSLIQLFKRTRSVTTPSIRYERCLTSIPQVISGEHLHSEYADNFRKLSPVDGVVPPPGDGEVPHRVYELVTNNKLNMIDALT